MRAEPEGEWSLRQSIQRRVMNEQVRGAEGSTWKLVVVQGRQTALANKVRLTSRARKPQLNPRLPDYYCGIQPRAGQMK